MDDLFPTATFKSTAWKYFRFTDIVKSICYFPSGSTKKAGVSPLDPANIPQLPLHLWLQTQLLRWCHWLPWPETAWANKGTPTPTDMGWEGSPYLHFQAQQERVCLLHCLQEGGAALLQGSPHIPGWPHQGLLQPQVQVSALLSSTSGKHYDQVQYFLISCPQLAW